MISHAPRERVSWNVFKNEKHIYHADGHAPRERVSWNLPRVCVGFKLNRSRSTWACELKYASLLIRKKVDSHAPRERVSWNPTDTSKAYADTVTLHVSVWVEMRQMLKQAVSGTVTLHVSVWVEIIFANVKGGEVGVTLHVSVWVEIDTHNFQEGKVYVTLHVSVWVEIYNIICHSEHLLSRSTWACELKCKCSWQAPRTVQSRSTWACELKFSCAQRILTICSHAPRERVSWNCTVAQPLRGLCRSRSTWACELKWCCLILVGVACWSRSTWACELK